MSEVIDNAREIITGYKGKKVRIMEVCGTHTHEIFRLGIRNLLPENVDLISGPGCPVCVTPVGFIDEAIFLALEKKCTICTFGDLIKVPGTTMNMARVRAEGADIRPVYSPDDAVELAKKVGTRIATVTTTTLKVRNGPGLDAEVIGLVPIEDELVVEEELDGWVKVDIEEGEGYVSLDYVELHTEFVTAESKEEEEARLLAWKPTR